MPGENHLLVVGIDQYPNFPESYQLDNAVHDAVHLRKVLEERYGYKSYRELLDGQATGENIVQAFNDLYGHIQPEDSLIIFVAGHTHLHKMSKKGYFIPYDGVDGKLTSYVPYSSILDTLETIHAKHVFLIIDSCFSGIMLNKYRSTTSPYSHDELESKRSRLIFTSGGEEKVKDGIAGDGSPFGKNIYKFLAENQSPAVSAEEMADAVKLAMSGKVKQTPQFGEWECMRHEDGQLVFRLSSESNDGRETMQKETFPLPVLPLVQYPIKRTVSRYEQKPDNSWIFNNEQEKSCLTDIIKREKKVALLGNAGSGKSVELYQAALSIKHPANPFIPVYKRFNTYVGEDIQEYLPTGWQDINPDRIVIFLDGLDEVQPQYFNTAVRKITAFAEKNPKRRIIISCRTNFYELPYGNFAGTLDGFSVYVLNDISLLEIRKYLIDHYAIDGDQFIREAFDRSLADLVQKPFFLNILIKHYIENGNFEIERAGIMEEALFNQFSNSLQRYNSTHKPPLLRQEALTLLGKIAFVMEMMGKNYLSEADLHNLFPELNEFEQFKFLPAFNYDSSFGKWQFEHNNIQEFLASYVLANQSFEKLLNIVTLPGTTKVKPSWANTLSFFVSIGEKNVKNKVLQWLLSNDKEFIIKFEPDRVPDGLRIKVVHDIIQNYNANEIWISSNKFTNKDLARFGSFPQTIEFLLSILNDPKSSRVAQMNALLVLDYFDLSKFNSYKESIKKALLYILEGKTSDHYFIYSVLRTFGSLGLTDKQTFDYIVPRYRKHTNEYIRAGLYKMINDSGLVDQYLDVYLEGLDLEKIEDPIMDRGDISLIDEDFLLLEGLKQIQSAKSIVDLLNYFANPFERKRIYLSDYKDIFTTLIQNAVKTFPTHSYLYDAVLKLFKTAVTRFDDDQAKMIIAFFSQTNTVWQTFKIIWKDDTIPLSEKKYIISRLINPALLDQLLEEYRSDLFSDAEIIALHDMLIWNEPKNANGSSLLEKLERGVFEIKQLALPRPVFINWAKINQLKNQEGFDLLFTKEGLINAIELIFNDLGTDQITQEQLHDLINDNWNRSENFYNLSAIDLLRDHMYGKREITKESIITWIDSRRFDYYQGRRFYDYLHGGYGASIIVSGLQRDFIAKLCESIANSVDIKALALRNDNLIMILWFFVQQYSIRLPEEKLLDFTYYFNFNSQVKLNDSGTIDELEMFISNEKIHQKVLDNLGEGIHNSLSWLNNAAYAVRKHLSKAALFIFRYLENADDKEYKLAELLELWYENKGDLGPLKQLTEKGKSEVLRQKAIALLTRSGKEVPFISELLGKIIDNESENIESRFFAANQLLSMGLLKGIEFITDYILKNPSAQMAYYNKIGQINSITNSDATSYLLKLLRLSKEPEFNSDKFGWFESKVIEAIYNIGVQSERNFNHVKHALENFLADDPSKSKSFNYLRLTVQRMEDQLLFNLTKGYSLQDAINAYDNVTS
jgi:hypothetical protein